MVVQHLASFTGQRNREPNTNSDMELWEEVPRYKVNCVTIKDQGIEWDAELYHVYLEYVLIVREPEEDSVADSLTVIDLVDSSSSNSNTCCIVRYF